MLSAQTCSSFGIAGLDDGGSSFGKITSERVKFSGSES
jgi:hypothetical protein